MNGEKLILDVTCGNRSIWFNREHPNAIYCDAFPREVSKTWKSSAKSGESTRVYACEPNVVADFTSLPFDDNSFHLVVFDPPHLINASEKSCMRIRYGSLKDDWREVLRKGVDECMRVLKPNGVLIFKWCAVHIPTADVIKAIGREPLFGHKSGKRSQTHWLTLMKF